MADRPFRVLGFEQVAIGGTDKQKMRELWIDTLGFELHETHRMESENVDEDILFAGKGLLQTELNLMQPIDPEKKPKVHEPPLNHIGLWVDDLKAAVDWLTAQGVRFTPGGIRRGAAGHDVCFIHPKGNESAPIGGCGVLIELIQAPANVREAFAQMAAR